MYKLPYQLYIDMTCWTDEEHEERYGTYAHKYYCNDNNKYITIEIMAKKLKNDKCLLHSYKISFRDYYRLSGIDGITKVIGIERYDWDSVYNEEVKDFYQQLINYICETMHKKKYKYDSFSSNMSSNNLNNTISTDIIFDRGEIYKNLTGIECSRRIEYICKDLDSEELDAIIYPEEYTHFKYENN